MKRMIISVSETATIPAVKSLLMEKRMMAAAQARAEVMMMMRPSVTDVFFSRINTSLFSAVSIVSLRF